MRQAGTGLAAGALLTAVLLGLFGLGRLAGIAFAPFTVFEWLIKVLPGRVVTFGLDLTLGALNGLGFNVKNTAKTAEQVLAVATLFIAGLIVGAVFFAVTRKHRVGRIRLAGLIIGAVAGLFAAGVTWAQDVPSSVGGKLGFAVWVLVLCLLWGWGMARLRLAAYPAVESPEPTSVRDDASPTAESTPPAAAEAPAAEARAISRRRFLIQMGGLAATIVVAGAGVATVLRGEAGGAGSPSTQTSFPNEDSPVEPAPGTRPEYTPVADHYRVDITLDVPQIDEAKWRLVVDGTVEKPLSLTLEQIRSDFRATDQFITLSCVSNLIGGPLIGTTLWTGAPLRDVLAKAKALPEARYAHLYGEDGFDEQIDLELVRDDPRIVLAYAWDNQPLIAKHGFPLRVYVPDRYGMKQPKWITRISLLTDSIPGYWVSRGWDEKAEVRTTSVIDTVATKSLISRDGQTLVPIGGIAYSGAKGISKVEIQVDNGAWQAAALREPLSELTWVIWRYDWPFSAGRHYFAVRCYDGRGELQVTESQPPSPKGATGLYDEYRDF
jgi:DMSO/TMAO reductase YedYZ molybdopterin-dependent catalytic subunit